LWELLQRLLSAPLLLLMRPVYMFMCVVCVHVLRMSVACRCARVRV
jgi:hypothetical protein